MTTEEEAKVVADYIKEKLAASGIPPLDLTTDDVLQILLECLDDFHEYSAPRARSIAADVLIAWRNESRY